MFRSVDPQVSFPKLEVALAQWWKESGVAKRGMNGREDGPDFIFFEGPPTANGPSRSAPCAGARLQRYYFAL